MKNILIIDDEPKIRNAYADLLSANGFEAAGAATFEDATGILNKKAIDLILLDLNMPEMDIRALHAEIRKIGNNVKVIVSSVYPVRRQVKCYPGANDYFDKSLGTEVLLEKVKEVFREKTVLAQERVALQGKGQEGARSPKISVIIPNYNRADLIRETLVSVEKQTLTPFEVIIVDDGSTDHSLQVIRDWKEKSKLDVHIFNNQNTKGQSGALNFGIAKASGEYIAMQDSDDLWAPCHLRQLTDALTLAPQCDIAFSRIQVFGAAKDIFQKTDEFLSPVTHCLKLAFKKKTDLLWVSHKKLLFSLLRYGFPFRCQASLIRNSFFDKTHLGFDEEIAFCLDAQFVTQAAYHTGFVYVDNVGLYWRRHPGNDGDLSYGGKIGASYEKRIPKLKQYFSDKSLDLFERSALAYRLFQLKKNAIMARMRMAVKRLIAGWKNGTKVECVKSSLQQET
jgi:glycosyltransferase involved in cell wall biosynthesis/ActR/RegA family two-component response regulator